MCKTSVLSPPPTLAALLVSASKGASDTARSNIVWCQITFTAKHLVAQWCRPERQVVPSVSSPRDFWQPLLHLHNVLSTAAILNKSTFYSRGKGRTATSLDSLGPVLQRKKGPYLKLDLDCLERIIISITHGDPHPTRRLGWAGRGKKWQN